MHLLAPAKINLHLRVGRRRDDGFHPLLTWMCTVGLFDILTLEVEPDAVLQTRTVAGTPPAANTAGGRASAAGGVDVCDDGVDHGVDPAAADVELVLRGDGDRPDLPRDGRNLVVRIAAAFVGELRGDGAPRRAGPGGQTRGPAFRGEGLQEPDFPTPARATPGAGAGSTASVGAAPRAAPGTEREVPPGAGGGRAVDDRAAAGPAGSGVGAVRGAEGSGRLDRRSSDDVRADGARADGAGAGADGARADGASADSARADGVGGARADEARAGRGVVRVTLDKRIPIGAGLGGGSSDAANTLVALDRLLSAGWTEERLSAFSARFGSDVPFFVAAARRAPSAACRGRGEVVCPVETPAARHVVVFSPPFGLSTRDVYTRFDEMGLGFDEALGAAAEPDWARWARLPARELMERLVNDLEPAAFSLSPDLAALRAQLERDVGRVVRMSGSGSSLFTLFDGDEEPAAREAVRLGNARGATAVVVGMAPAVG